jgi:hypothetical protein
LNRFAAARNVLIFGIDASLQRSNVRTFEGSNVQVRIETGAISPSGTDGLGPGK